MIVVVLLAFGLLLTVDIVIERLARIERRRAEHRRQVDRRAMLRALARIDEAAE